MHPQEQTTRPSREMIRGRPGTDDGGQVSRLRSMAGHFRTYQTAFSP